MREALVALAETEAEGTWLIDPKRLGFQTEPR